MKEKKDDSKESEKGTGTSGLKKKISRSSLDLQGDGSSKGNQS